MSAFTLHSLTLEASCISLRPDGRQVTLTQDTCQELCRTEEQLERAMRLWARSYAEWYAESLPDHIVKITVMADEYHAVIDYNRSI